MIFLWISFALFWLYVALTTKDVSETVWAGLFFLWILLALHYFKSYRKWKREDNLRRKEREKELENRNVPSSES